MWWESIHYVSHGHQTPSLFVHICPVMIRLSDLVLFSLNATIFIKVNGNKLSDLFLAKCTLFTKCGLVLWVICAKVDSSTEM